MATPILKLCVHCGVEKPLEDFAVRNAAGGVRRGKCKPCSNAVKASKLASKDAEEQQSLKAYHSQKSREWYQRTKAENPELIKGRNLYVAARRQAYKAFYVAQRGGKCAHCGGEFPDCVFDFHHEDGKEKKRAPAQAFALSKKKIEEEISKCIMLCANCHRVEHERLNYADHAKRPFHGKMDIEIFEKGRARGPSPQKGLPKPSHSKAMKAYWASKERTPSPMKGVPRPAHSEAMKAYWRRVKDTAAHPVGAGELA
jgi:hypothetical protein